MNFTEEQLTELNVSTIKRTSENQLTLEDYSNSRPSLSKNIIQFRNGFVNLKDSGYDNLQIAMSVVSELMNFGYIVNQDGIGNISRASKEDIVIFHNEVLDYIKTMTGSDRDYQPFWPNFPESVMNKSEAELWIHQIIHYSSNGTYIPNELTRRSRTAFEHANYTTLDSGDDVMFSNIFTNLVSVNGSLSPDDKDVVQWFVDSDWKLNLPNQIPFKETLCFLVSIGVKCEIKTVTDVLRVAVYMSGGDISLRKNTKNKTLFKKFKRSERKMILSLLESTRCDESEAVLKLSKWIRLGEILHPGEYKNKFPKSFNMFKRLRNDKVISWNASVDKEFKEDLESGLKKLSERPGEFFRRIDALVRKNTNQIDKILTYIKSVGTKVSNKVLFETYEHFGKRANKSDFRSITLSGSRSNFSLPTLEKLSEYAVNSIQKSIKDSLRVKFKELPKMSNVWIDEELKNIPMPKNMRSVSSSLVPIIRGERIKVKNKDAKVIRAFVHWFDERGNQDLDLTAIFIGDNKVEHIGWNGGHNSILGCYSGDVRHKKGACAEYIDIKVDKALANGYKYVVMDVRNYNNTGFNSLPQCVGGCMEREDAVKGEVWLPKTIEGSMRLQSESNSTIMFVFDLEKMEYIILDVDSIGNVASSNFQEISNSIREYCEPPVFSVYDLIMMHVDARGGKVSKKEDADNTFELKDFRGSYVETLKLMGV